jgi:hypothetical protein
MTTAPEAVRPATRDRRFYDDWLAARSDELKPAPKRLGNARHKAPDTYVHAS